ncbi:MAG: protein translocase subunit SecD [Syntrophales bacterium]|jgi:preprotein translocase subunit SecD|nr:protein translocase subunit SecD [Syntrophales bacterium]MDY0043929.1 protein translocase subunit SecD [Syntrophales bacterium]
MFDRNIKARIGISLIVILIALFYLMPSLTDHIPSFWKKNLPSEKIHLGLDLQGGMHLVLEVQADKAVESSVERIANNLQEFLMEKRIRFRNLERVDGTFITIELASGEASDRFRTLLNDNFSNLIIADSKVSEGRETLRLTLQNEQIQSIKKFAHEQSLETIRNRVDQFGVSEPEIVPQADGRILVQLPGIKDPQRAINLIGKTALLEFKLVDDGHSLDEALKGNVPPGDVLAYGSRLDPSTGQRTRVPYLLQDKTLLTGESLEDAKVAIGNRFGEPYVAIKFDSQGARDFERITGQHVKERLAIVLDGVVHSAPVIQERISGGNAQITGNFTMEEAHDLAIVLRAGALPAPVDILEQRTVGPSLGQDSINKGFLSIIIGMIIVLIFMIFYYSYSGIIADTALILNILIILGALAAFKATLTLPGIAGIVLTIGMAVDANVLIFERIREELRIGKSPRAAVAAGYGKALITIIDANITTLIAAVVLFQFGTGPVKGFAVTLSIGIVSSMFTAIFVTRIIYDYLIWHRKIKLVRI